MENLKRLLLNDPFRMKVLQLVAALELPDCYVAAGFVRNMVWDHLHGFAPSKLNDIDVVFFNNNDTSRFYCEQAKAQLSKAAPNVNWQVKNQAVMHLKNNDRPYRYTDDAMSYWPEKETAVGMQLDYDGSLGIVAPFGIASLFRGEITHNPKRDQSIFLDRIKSKNWLTTWPKLKVIY